MCQILTRISLMILLHLLSLAKIKVHTFTPINLMCYNDYSRLCFPCNYEGWIYTVEGVTDEITRESWRGLQLPANVATADWFTKRIHVMYFTDYYPVVKVYTETVPRLHRFKRNWPSALFGLRVFGSFTRNLTVSCAFPSPTHCCWFWVSDFIAWQFFKVDFLKL